MRTRMMISLIVSAALGVAAAAFVGLVWRFGWLGGAGVWLGGAAAVMGLYALVIRPWHLRWGATDLEVAQPMPGDELIADAKSVTRAMTIDAPPAEVWPWLVQLGFGRAGWYSYDWIDNDSRPSANRIIPEHQNLEVGDQILMTPTVGFRVEALDPPHSMVSILADGSTSWSLGLFPTPAGATRLVSRWRPANERTPAALLMSAIVEPGTFVMEQKMLRSIRDRVEARSPLGR